MSETPGVALRIFSIVPAAASISRNSLPRTLIMIGASVAAPSTNGGSVAVTLAPGINWAARRPASFSAPIETLRSALGVVAMRQRILFGSPSTPTVEDRTWISGVFKSSFSAMADRREVLASAVPAGSSDSTTNWLRSSEFTNSEPMSEVTQPMNTMLRTANAPTASLWRTAQPSIAA